MEQKPKQHSDGKCAGCAGKCQKCESKREDFMLMVRFARPLCNGFGIVLLVASTIQHPTTISGIIVNGVNGGIGFAFLAVGSFLYAFKDETIRKWYDDRKAKRSGKHGVYP